MNDDIFNFLLITSGIHGIIFNIITLTFYKKKKISKAIIYLNLLVLSISLNNLQAWLISKDYSSSWFLIKNLEVPWYLFILPMFYSFLIHFLLIENKYRKIGNFFILIFLIETSIRLILITYCYNISSDIVLIKSYTQIEEIINAFLSVTVFIKSYKIIFKEQHNYQYALSFDDVTWLKQFIVLGSLVLTLWFVAIIANIHLKIPQRNMYYPLRIGSSLLLYWIGYQGFLRYNVMSDRIHLRKEILKNKASYQTHHKPKTESNSLLFENICKYIETNKTFLNPNVNLDNVSKDLQISSSHLSKIINKNHNLNFTDLINEYRVDHAKTLLLNPNFNNYTIIAIGLESGFNSKSTFYNAFKKFTSQTPSGFRSKNSE